MEILRIIAIAMTGIIFVAITRSIKPELTIYVTLATILILLMFILGKVQTVFGFLKTIYDEISYGKEFFPIIIKVLVVAYLTDFTSQLCKDSGEGAIGNKVELAGKVIIFYLSMPIIISILELINSIL